MSSDRRARFVRAAETASRIDPSEWPGRVPARARTRLTRDQDRRFAALRQRRNGVAATLAVDADLVAPRAALNASLSRVTAAWACCAVAAALAQHRPLSTRQNCYTQALQCGSRAAYRQVGQAAHEPTEPPAPAVCRGHRGRYRVPGARRAGELGPNPLSCNRALPVSRVARSRRPKPRTSPVSASRTRT